MQERKKCNYRLSQNKTSLNVVDNY